MPDLYMDRHDEAGLQGLSNCREQDRVREIAAAPSKVPTFWDYVTYVIQTLQGAQLSYRGRRNRRWCKILTFPLQDHQCECECRVASVMSDTLRPHGLYPARLLCPWDSPGKDTGVGRHFLLQGNLPDPGMDPHLLHWQAGSLPLAPPGKSQIPHLLSWAQDIHRASPASDCGPPSALLPMVRPRQPIALPSLLPHHLFRVSNGDCSPSSSPPTDLIPQLCPRGRSEPLDLYSSWSSDGTQALTPACPRP